MQNSPPGSKSRQRRAHRKSRNGCAACKARRTKCDEQGPPCVNCVIRKTECVYPNGQSTRAEIESIALSTPESSPSAATSASVYGERNLLELKLLFQWTMHTAESLEGGERDRQEWRTRITPEAFSFEPLLDAIMALSAAHIADGMKTTQEDRANFVNASLEYYGRCCEKFKNEVMNINKDNSRTFLSCSLALILLRMHIPEYGQDVESCVDRVLAAFELLQGTWSIAHVVHDPNDGPLNKPLMLNSYESKELDESTNEALGRLEKLNELFESTSDPVRSHRDMVICNQATELLRQWWMRAHCGGHGVALIWLLCVSRDFVSLVRDKNQVAQLVLLHWSVLFEHVNGDSRWFSRRIGKRLVQELTVALGDLHVHDERWRLSISWANHMVFRTTISDRVTIEQ